MASSHRAWWALGALSLAVLALGLDATVLSVALPTLARDLRASTTDLQWFVSGYTLVLAAAVLPGGMLGDRYGRKRVLLVALGVFGIGSLPCALASSAAAFTAARLVLALGAATVIPLSLSALTVLFDDTQRPRAVAVWSAANFIALPVGPIFGGWLLTHFWWGWVFLLNLPVVVVGMIAVAAFVPESRSARRPAFDLPGIAFSCAGLAALTFGFIQAGQSGWNDGWAWAAVAGGLLLLVGFWLWERRLGSRPGGQPLVDLDLFRAPAFTWGVVLSALGIFGMFGILFIMPMYFQAIVHTDAMGSGLRLLPLIAGIVVGAGLGSRAGSRLGPKVTVGTGLGVMAGSLALGATTSASSGTAFVAAWTAGAGVGMGMALTTAAAGALAELSAERAGVGSAVMQAVQKLGAPLAAAILGSVLNSTYQARLVVAGLPGPVAAAVRGSVFAGVAVSEKVGSPALMASVRGAFVSGIDTMLVVSAVVAASGMVLGLAFLPGRAVVRAAREAGRAVA